MTRTVNADVNLPVTVRLMRPEEYEDVRALSVAAFGDEPGLGALLDALRAAGRGRTSFRWSPSWTASWSGTAC